MHVSCHACIGGKSIGEDMKALGAGCQVVSGTPGRVHDMITRRALSVRKLRMLVIDEADEMLSAGFKEQLYDIYRHLPPHTQIVLVSATMPNDVLALTAQFMHDPVRILVKRDELTLEGIKQYFVAVDKSQRSHTAAHRTLTTPSNPPLKLSLPPLSVCAVRGAGRSGSSTRCATCTTC